MEGASGGLVGQPLRSGRVPRAGCPGLFSFAVLCYIIVCYAARIIHFPLRSLFHSDPKMTQEFYLAF